MASSRVIRDWPEVAGSGSRTRSAGLRRSTTRSGPSARSGQSKIDAKKFGVEGPDMTSMPQAASLRTVDFCFLRPTGRTDRPGRNSQERCGSGQDRRPVIQGGRAPPGLMNRRRERRAADCPPYGRGQGVAHASGNCARAISPGSHIPFFDRTSAGLRVRAGTTARRDARDPQDRRKRRGRPRTADQRLGSEERSLRHGALA